MKTGKIKCAFCEKPEIKERALAENDLTFAFYEPRKFLYRPGSRAETPEKELREIALEIKKLL